MKHMQVVPPAGGAVGVYGDLTTTFGDGRGSTTPDTTAAAARITSATWCSTRTAAANPLARSHTHEEDVLSVPTPEPSDDRNRPNGRDDFDTIRAAHWHRGATATPHELRHGYMPPEDRDERQYAALVRQLERSPLVDWDKREMRGAYPGPPGISLKVRRIFWLAVRDGLACWYCKVTLLACTATVDHMTPRVRGGSHHFTNLCLACSTCNDSKNDRTAEEYLADLAVAA